MHLLKLSNNQTLTALPLHNPVNNKIPALGPLYICLKKLYVYMKLNSLEEALLKITKAMLENVWNWNKSHPLFN